MAEGTVAGRERADISRLPAYVLAGGKSSRFFDSVNTSVPAAKSLSATPKSTDKALVEIDGQTQVLRICSQLKQAGHTVQLVADRADRFAALGQSCLVDAAAQCGPVGGLATALEDRQQSGAGWLLLVSVDQLVWRERWSIELQAETARTGEEKNALQAIVFQVEGRKQPFPGLFHTSALPAVQEMLRTRSQSESLSMKHALAQMNVRCVMPEGGNPKELSFNTHQELAALLNADSQSGL